MRRFLTPLVVVIAIGAALYAAYTWAYPSGTIRYRLTIEVMVDQKTYSGSTVIEAKYSVQPSLAQYHVTGGVRGQAAVIDLGPKGKLFVTLQGPPSSGVADYPSYLADLPATKLLNLPSGSRPSDAQIRSLGHLVAKADLSDSDLPIMVRFEDMSNPRSVRLVLPSQMPAIYGPGSHIVGARIETTTEPMVGGVTKILPWLRDLRG